MIKPLMQDDAFLADVHASLEDRSHTLRLWWLGQSGFLLQCRGWHLLFDPYLSDSLTTKYAATEKPHVRMTERVVAPDRLDFVDVITSTHNHADHLDADTIIPISRASRAKEARLMGIPAPAAMEPTLVIPEANEAFVKTRLSADGCPQILMLRAWEHTSISKTEVLAVPAAHDQLTVDELGRNVYLGYVVRHRGWTVYHSGDTVVYDGMVEDLKSVGPIDVAILPINGKVGNMNGADAARLARDIGAKLVAPCHYEMFEFNTASPYELFVPECERLGQPYKVLRAGERLTLTK